jgi:hypothetical protein
LRYLSADQQNELSTLFTALQDQPVLDMEQTLRLPEQQALDRFVFKLLGFSDEEGAAVIEGLLERMQTRQFKARA